MAQCLCDIGPFFINDLIQKQIPEAHCTSGDLFYLVWSQLIRAGERRPCRCIFFAFMGNVGLVLLSGKYGLQLCIFVFSALCLPRGL